MKRSILNNIEKYTLTGTVHWFALYEIVQNHITTSQTAIEM
jgi:hypothetical protein